MREASASGSPPTAPQSRWDSTGTASRNERRTHRRDSRCPDRHHTSLEVAPDILRQAFERDVPMYTGLPIITWPCAARQVIRSLKLAPGMAARTSIFRPRRRVLKIRATCGWYTIETRKMNPYPALREPNLPKSKDTTKSVGGYGRKSEFAGLASANVLDARRMFYFFHVVRTGSFTVAEATLDIAQSTLSRQIQQLEEDVGEQLLLRTGRGVALTHAGEIVYRQAEAILREMSVVREQLAPARQSARGSISIAASRPFTTRFLPEIIDRFVGLFPDVHLTVHEASSGHVYQYLADGVVDFAVVLHSPNSQKITTKKLLNEQLNLVVRNDHPLATTKSVTRKSLGTIDLMLPATPHGTRSILEKYFEAGDLVIDPTLRLDSVSLMKEVIAQGKYAAILPSMACEAQLLDGSFVAIPLNPPISRTLYLASLRDRPRTKIYEAMEQVIIDTVGENVVSTMDGDDL